MCRSRLLNPKGKGVFFADASNKLFYYMYCKLVRGLEACLCLQLLPFNSLLLGDATNGMASL